MAGLMTFQTLDSEDMVPLTTDLSDLIRALSDLCIQAYQQLLSITETRLQNIIGTTLVKKILMVFLRVLLSSLFFLLLLPLSPCHVGE